MFMSWIQKYQWQALWMIFGVITSVLLVTIWSIYPIYISAQIRNDVKARIIERSDYYGLPISDFSAAFVRKDEFRICRRIHQKGLDNMVCDEFYSVNEDQ